MKILILLLLTLPCALQAQIFRCEMKGDTYYSQIPCDDSSEAVVIEDQLMFSEHSDGVVPLPEAPVAAAEPVRTEADNLLEFVATLRKQRSGQLEQLDKDIGQLDAQLKAFGDSPEDTAQREALSERLTDLQNSRDTIAEQYDSMIVEAERRVAALTVTEPSVTGKMK